MVNGETPDRVEQLKPDLVIASKEENTREDVEACRAFTEVLVTDVRTIPDAFEALEAIGDALEKAAAGVTWRSNIETAWGEPRAQHAQALYAIWQNPLMVAGHDTYIHAAMNWWGIGNAALMCSRRRGVDVIRRGAHAGQGRQGGPGSTMQGCQ